MKGSVSKNKVEGYWGRHKIDLETLHLFTCAPACIYVYECVYQCTYIYSQNINVPTGIHDSGLVLVLEIALCDRP